MTRYIAEAIATSLLLFALSPAQAGVIHKWVDSNGITHYADAPPGTTTYPVTQIEVPDRQPAVASDYYSITNQWRRLHQERLELERIRLEQARIRSIQDSSKPDVIVIEQPGEGRPVRVYQKYRPRHHRAHHRHKYRPPPPSRSIPRNWLAQKQRGGLYQPHQRSRLY